MTPKAKEPMTPDMMKVDPKRELSPVVYPYFDVRFATTAPREV